MNVVVTGGNGFLGSNIVRRFLKDNHNLLVFSRNSNNILDILDKIEYVPSDNESLLLHKNTIKRFSPNVVIHCGWFGGNSHTDIDDPGQFHYNLPSSIKLVEFLNELKTKPSFVGFGSFAEYGEIRHPITEYEVEKPVNLYGLSKLAFKNYSQMLCKKFNIDWTWIRPCYIYGPNDVKTRFIPTLISRFIKNENITLDECNTTIDYLYIDDFTNYVYELIIIKSTGIYNLCSGNQYKLRDIIQITKELLNSSSEVIFDKSKNRSSVFNYICGDNEKLKSALNIENSVDLIKGLTKTINYERSSYLKG
jgi:nucleoside-diphosphate-sugar epimerase